MTIFLFIRHGETAWNVEKRIQGQLDIPLNDLGRAQALAVRDALASTKVAAVLSSPLSRALDTAQPSALAHGLPVRPLPSLAERHFGLLQGHSSDTRREQSLELVYDRARRDPHFVPEGGESLSGFLKRVELAVAEVIGVAGVTEVLDPDAVVLVFTHGGVLEMLYRMTQGMGLAEPCVGLSLANGAFNRLVHRGGERLELIEWADRRHLLHLTPGIAAADHRPI